MFAKNCRDSVRICFEHFLSLPAVKGRSNSSYIRISGAIIIIINFTWVIHSYLIEQEVLDCIMMQYESAHQVNNYVIKGSDCGIRRIEGPRRLTRENPQIIPVCEFM